MAAANYTFLPWARRGLAARVGTVDAGTVGPALPAHAKVAVGLTLSAIPKSAYDLTLYGPGDVLGIDSRLIIRTDPRPDSTEVEPNYFPLIEFDPPDFPWMFTPATSGPGDRLRPWCVLVAVDLSVVDPPRVERGNPLPVLTVPGAVAAVELPDLAESWAWAHAQVTAPPQGLNIPTDLAGRPAMNVSRLIAPRRLEPGKRYAACLVPAFDAGVASGLGLAPADGAPLGPAWPTPGDVRLPVYFHWEFATGLVGDFKELAGRLQPYQPSQTAGGQRMYIGAAGPELPAMPPADPAAFLEMDGALRPWKGSPAKLADVPVPVQEHLRAALDAAAVQVTSGPTSTTPVLGPPIYGAWHARQHTVPPPRPAPPQSPGADLPSWLRELNLDPRARAAAGLGAEIERQNQEQFMQWCWEQVEQILEANRQLSRARLSLEALARVYARHFVTLPPDRLLQITAPLHSRTNHAGATVAAMIASSSLPDAAVDPALRRLTSPQRPVLRAAIARAAPSSAPGPITPRMHLVARLAGTGVGLQADPTSFIPHGLLGIPAITSVPVSDRSNEAVDLSAIGLPLSVEAVVVELVRRDSAAATASPIPHIVERDDLGRTGMWGEERLRLVREALKGRLIPPLIRDPATVQRLTDALSGVPFITDPETIRRLTDALSRVTAGSPVIPGPSPRSVSMAMDPVRGSLLARINPRLTVPSRLRTMVAVGEQSLLTNSPAGLTVAPTLDRVMAAPAIDIPVYGYLARLDSARFFPGIDEVLEDAITVLETNPRFVEALLVGLNDEMNRELLWRGFPTDQRGTPFRRFWDRSGGATDIGPIHTWPAGNGLGANGSAGPGDAGGQIALLLRGQLLRRYPNTSIYAWRSSNGALVNPPNAPDDIRHPVFAGVLGLDATFVGFDLTDIDLRQGDGWFFVLQEQPTEPRFGFGEFDGTGTPPALHSWSDTTWQHTGTVPGRYLRITGNPLAGKRLPLAGKTLPPVGPPEEATFVVHASHLAAITMQKPVRVAVHAGGLPQLSHPPVSAARNG